MTRYELRDFLNTHVTGKPFLCGFVEGVPWDIRTRGHLVDLRITVAVHIDVYNGDVTKLCNVRVDSEIFFGKHVIVGTFKPNLLPSVAERFAMEWAQRVARHTRSVRERERGRVLT